MIVQKYSLDRKGRKHSFGKKLTLLHRWNAWIALFLALTGIVLSIGTIRGELGEGRVWLKQLHIIAGVLSAALLVLYAPNLFRHLKQIRGMRDRQFNLAVVIVLLIGWIVSGIVLWQFRQLPTSWANTAIVVHDLFTWIGVPYAIYHSLTRMRWLKTRGSSTQFTIKEHATPMSQTPIDVDHSSAEEGSAASVPATYRPPITGTPKVTRRVLLKTAIGLGLSAIILPPFYRWLSGTSPIGDSGLMKEDGNVMLPTPTPLPDSKKVIGGGSKGQFRIYTVTPIPSFNSTSWRFKVDGLVDHPLTMNWEQFLQVPRIVQVSDFHCITGWSVLRNTWEGIRLSDLLDVAGAHRGAKFVKFYSGDGVYTDTLSIEQARENDMLIAVLHDGKPITSPYGGPVRLIVPRMYAYKSVKWLNRIELIDKPHIGYWEARGYENDAWIRT